MALRACDAGGKGGVPPHLHGLPVLGVHHRQRAQRPAACQSRQQLRVRNLRTGVAGASKTVSKCLATRGDSGAAVC